jgi:hypothetical protein
MATDSRLKEELDALLDDLPETALREVASFVEFQRFKLGQHAAKRPPYRPVRLGGLWQGITVDEGDIADARREMWARFAEAEP